MDNIQFRYADTNEQVKRANFVLMAGMVAYYFLLLITVVVAMISGARSAGFTGLIVVVTIIFLAADFIAYFRDKSSKITRYVALVSTLILGFFVGFAFSSYYVRLMTITPFVATVVFFDYKFQKRACIAMSIMQIMTTVFKLMTGQNMEDVSTSDVVSVTIAIIVVMLFTVVAVKTVIKFQEDTLGSLNHEKEMQAKMVEEIMVVADNIKDATN